MRSSRALVCAVLAGLLAACDQRPAGSSIRRTATPPASAVEALGGGDTAGYEAAVEPRDFVFPDDNGPHPEFKTEWWYFTGHLRSDAGQRFGYQLTFFRQALAPKAPARTSAWATRQVMLAHFALTDVAGDVFTSAERLSRAAAGLAGAQAVPLKVWLGDWSVASSTADTFPLRLRAESLEPRRFAIDLTVEPLKPPVFHGDRGLSRKGDGPGDASYYFSYSRLETRGTVTLGDRVSRVDGASWLDREWSTSVLGKDQVGWDWFSIQLEDQRELMIFELRRSDGGVDPVSHGTLIAADGSGRPLAYDEFDLQVLATWRSDDGVVYPARWRLRVPLADLDLNVEPLVADQELDVSFRYWEGAVSVRSAGASEARGLGYVELVGYAEAPASAD